jgi:hypothetical protein
LVKQASFLGNKVEEILIPYSGKYGNYTTYWSIPATVSVNICSNCHIFHIKKVLQPHTVCVCTRKCFPLSWGEYGIEIILHYTHIHIQLFTCLNFALSSFSSNLPFLHR